MKARHYIYSFGGAYSFVFALAALIAWLGGYNFDERNLWLALYCLGALAAGFGASICTCTIVDDHLTLKERQRQRTLGKTKYDY